MTEYFCKRKRCDYLEQTGTKTHFCLWARCPYGARVARSRPTVAAKKPAIEPADEEYIARMNELNNGPRFRNHRFTPDEIETIYRERRAGDKITDIAARHGWARGSVYSVCWNIAHGGNHYRALIDRGIDVRPFGEE